MTEEEFVLGVDRLKLVQSERRAIEGLFKEEKGIASAMHKEVCKEEKAALKPFVEEYEESSKALGEAQNNYNNSPCGGPIVDGVKLLVNYDFTIIDSSKIPKMFWCIDEKKLKDMVKASKGDANIPGIETVITHKLSVSGKGE